METFNNDESKEKVGMAIGVICNGYVPIKWMMHMMNLGKTLPGGLYWSYIYACGDFKKDPTKNYATQRLEVVQKALESKSKYLLFIDSDVFVPSDAINRLMSHDVDIVNGIYWMKTTPPQPVIYESIGNGPIWKIEPKDELLEIGGAGLGCCLIKTSVFEKFIEKGVDIFKQNWSGQRSGRTVKVDIGEDHWFFDQARKLGFKIYADTNVLCDHYDANTEIFYPDAKIVQEICRKKLKAEGHDKLVEHNELVKNVEKEKPTILFYNANGVKFNGDSIKEKAIAGSETAVIQMAKNLKDLGWNSHVFCNTENDGTFDDVAYHHYSKINDGMIKISEEIGHSPEVFIASRDFRPFLGGRPPVKKTVLWLHDMPQESLKELPLAMENIDCVFFVSEFQKNEYQKYFENKLPEEKLFVTTNGLDESRFDCCVDIEKIRGKCIYATTPFRGLDVLMGVWPKIKEKVPFAELHVYSSMSIYAMNEYPETQKIFDYGKTIAKKNDIFFHDPIKQSELAEVLCESDLMLYPSHFLETSCIAAMESIKAKTPIITTNAGALTETIESGEGILISGDSHSDEYGEKFIEETIDMLTNDNLRNNFCTKSRDLSWKSVANRWCDILIGGIKKVEIVQTNGGKQNVNTESYWNTKHENVKNNKEKGMNVLGDKERAETLSKIIPEKSFVLDVGFGDGVFLQTLYEQQKCAGLYGAEISDFAIKDLKERAPLIECFKTELKPSVIPIKNMDVVSAFHVLEHLENPKEYIECWKKSLNPDGEMILVIPLNDHEYIEHLKIYNLGDVEKLAQEVASDYEIKTRWQGWSYKDTGESAKEAVVRLWFN